MAEMDAARPRKPRARKAPEEARADTPDPVELAMAAASSGKPLPDAARNVLEKHARLIDCQIGEFRLRKIGESVRAALWAILAVAAFGVVILLGAVLVSATRADALIVQSFRVPPSLEAKGLTGEVVATQVLDKLAGMQEGSRNPPARRRPMPIIGRTT